MFGDVQLGPHDTLNMLCGSMHLTSAIIMVKARKMNDGESETRPRKEASGPPRPPSLSAPVIPTQYVNTVIPAQVYTLDTV